MSAHAEGDCLFATRGSADFPEGRQPRPGAQLRRLRVQIGITRGEVIRRSQAMAGEYGNEEFAISQGRLAQLENDDSTPSIFKLFTLSEIYGVPFPKLLTLYVDTTATERMRFAMLCPKTRILSTPIQPSDDGTSRIRMNTGQPLDQSAVLEQISRAWGDVPAPLLGHVSELRPWHVLIGANDYTMYPLIRPGSVVQVCETAKMPKAARCRSEYDRPIYLIETRSGYVCSWCETLPGRLISIPHPLSPCRTRAYACPREAEIVGIVTGIVMRLPRDQADARRRPEPDGSSLAAPTGPDRESC